MAGLYLSLALPFALLAASHFLAERARIDCCNSVLTSPPAAREEQNVSKKSDSSTISSSPSFLPSDETL